MTEQKQPPTRWTRIQDAANRLGVPADVLLSAIECGQADIRLTRIGRRRLRLVAEEDIEPFRRRMAYETIE